LTQREKSKGRKVSGRVAGGDALAPARTLSLDERYRVLEGERDRLRNELEAARAEITRLEAARNDVANRIDWVIDSLHNILESER
jgi:chromosome segregation ATPase